MQYYFNKNYNIIFPEINSEDQGVGISSEKKNPPLINDDEDDEPSMLDTLSSEQLARRPSFKSVECT